MEALDCPLAAGFVWSSEESSEEDIQEGSALSRRSSSMSSQTEAFPSLHPVRARASTEEEEKRKRNRLSQRRCRRNTRNELVLLRLKSVKYYERHMALREQLMNACVEKNAALAVVEAQKRQIEELAKRLGVCAQEYGDLQTKFSVMVNAHCALLTGRNAVAQMNAEQASQNGQQCVREAPRFA